MSGEPDAEDLVRRLAPQVLAAMVRRHGDFARCEDAVQEAVIAAHQQRRAGIPEHPLGWLRTVATRRLVDGIRADAARERREARIAAQVRLFAPAADQPGVTGDDTLALLFLCCHPALTAPAQLTLACEPSAA
nr:sigma factor [Nakamurella leprariae]